MLAFLTPHIGVGYDIPTTRAVDMLVAVGAGTVTFIGIVFSLLFLVVQFATTTYTPRLNLFRDDPIVWRSFAFYTALVVYALTAALVISGQDTTSAVVPIVAFGSLLAALMVFRRLQMSAFSSIQLASVLAQVARRGREVIDDLYQHEAPADGSNHKGQPGPEVGEHTHAIRWPHRAGVLQGVDVPDLVRAADSFDTHIRLPVGIGDVISEGGAIAVVNREPTPGLACAVLKATTVGPERTFEQDPAFALRVLADIALRALSPAVNDPTTAVQALDAMDGLLRILATRDLNIGHVAGSDGTLRVELPLPTWEDYVAVALDEIIALPTISPTISRRVSRLLDDLAQITQPNKRPTLNAHRQALAPVRADRAGVVE